MDFTTSNLKLQPGAKILDLGCGLEAESKIKIMLRQILMKVNYKIQKNFLIVIAGSGMFGAVIKETGIGQSVGQYLGSLGLGLLVPFLMTLLLETALGSSTVAIITASSFIAIMLPILGLDSEMGRVFAVLAMGSGSMAASLAFL